MKAKPTRSTPRSLVFCWPADGLDPAECLLDALADALADAHSRHVASCARRWPSVGRWCSGATCGVTPHRAQLVDEVLGVVALVGAERDPSRPVGARLDHGERRHPLGMAVGPASDRHRRKGRCGSPSAPWPMKQSLASLPGPLRVEPGVRDRWCEAWVSFARVSPWKSRSLLRPPPAAPPSRPSAGSSSSRPRPRSACRRPRSVRSRAAA